MSQAVSEQSPMPAAPPPQAVLNQLAFGFVISRVLYVLAELGVADQLKNGGRTADQIAAAVGAHAPSLYRVLRTAASIGLFTEEGGRFSLTPLSELLISDAPGYMRSTIRTMAGPMSWQSWGEFLHSVKTGEDSVRKALGMPIFEYLAGNPSLGALFNESMIGFHGDEPPAVAAAYDFSGVGRLVDVGGGTGNLLTTILVANPGVRGLLCDAPAVAAAARREIQARGVADRCEVAEVNFFEAVPSGGDVYMLSHIIHDWSDEQSVAILKNVRAAMPRNGKLLIVEMVLPGGSAFHPGKMLDLVMLAMTSGRERTADEYAALVSKAGFRFTRVVPTASAVSVVEAVVA